MNHPIAYLDWDNKMKLVLAFLAFYSFYEKRKKFSTQSSYHRCNGVISLYSKDNETNCGVLFTLRLPKIAEKST